MNNQVPSNWDYRISQAVAFYFIASTANGAIKSILPIPESMWGLLSLMWGVLILLFFLYCIPEVYRRNHNLLIKSFLLFGLVYMVSAILCIQRGEPIDLMISGSAFLTFAWWIPVGVFVCSIRDLQVLYKVLLKASYIISVLAIMMFVLDPIHVDKYGHPTYNIFFGSRIIAPLLFHINELYKKRNIKLLLYVLLEIVILVAFSNRGVILSLIFFVFYKSFVSSKKKGGLSSNKKILAFCTAIIIVLAFPLIVNSFMNLLESFGLQSRTLNMIMDNSIESTSGRDEIWKDCKVMISERPLLGWGLGGEYYQLAAMEGQYEVDSTASPHNAMIQNLVNFGIIIGMIVNLIFIFPLIRLRKISDISRYEIMLIYASASFIPCLISADGLFIKPEIAIYLYLFYYYSRKKYGIIKDVASVA